MFRKRILIGLLGVLLLGSAPFLYLAGCGGKEDGEETDPTGDDNGSTEPIDCSAGPAALVSGLQAQAISCERDEDCGDLPGRQRCNDIGECSTCDGSACRDGIFTCDNCTEIVHGVGCCGLACTDDDDCSALPATQLCSDKDRCSFCGETRQACRSDSDCAPEEYCTGFFDGVGCCDPEFRCESDADCGNIPERFACDTTLDECKECGLRVCPDDATCQAEFNENFTCQIGPEDGLGCCWGACQDNADCPVGMACARGQCKQVTSKCTSHAECVELFSDERVFCVTEATGSQCTSCGSQQDICESDQDCSEGFSCGFRTLEPSPKGCCLVESFRCGNGFLEEEEKCEEFTLNPACQCDSGFDCVDCQCVSN